ncbi:MAG: HAMP domain-containing protein [Deltaproteobacteria bacterium]|nr:HAMP domain-containing protein [Deltaproteobacteria bacterium]MBW2392989.1 HAMP domain-containing protein [Deltaproteobacteria bacterium]
MSEPVFESGRAFHLRLTLLWSVIGIPGAMLCALYLMTILILTPEQWSAFGLGVALVAIGLTFFAQIFLRRFTRPIRQAIDAEVSGDLAADELRIAFSALARLPYRSVRDTLINWGCAALFVPLFMAFRLESISTFTGLVVAAAAISGGTVAAVFTFFAVKRMDAPLLNAWAQRLPDGCERAELMPHVPMSAKLVVPMLAVSVVTLFFALLLSDTFAGRPVEAQDVRVKQAYLSYCVDELAKDAETLERLREIAVAFSAAHTLLIIDRGTRAIVDGPADGLRASEVDWLLDRAESSAGESTRFDSENSFAWQSLDASNGKLLVAVTPGSVFTADQAGSRRAFVGLMCIALIITFLTCRVLASDVSTTTLRLIARAEKIAEGDFLSQEVVESEDELGVLGRAFDRMVGSLREMIGRVAAAADGLDRAVGDLGAIGEAVTGATDAQREDIERATAQVAAVNHKVSEITGSAQALNANVEEASSSILELGAASEELNQTATTLSNHVEEVGGSIEQMIRSVAQVGENTEGLAGGVSETASSMSEMAAAMTEVDGNASQAASLSSQVVMLSERGQERVHETISGMEAIRDATQVADTVIGSLAARMAEIGAIVDVIDDVADETNLLALNAAIIAAQAGDQGRSFSVVADEIKDLADRVLTSTKEIGDLIRSVQSETVNATDAIGRGTESVLSGVELAADAGLALEEITGAARDSGGRIEEIVQAVREQAGAARHVAGLMERVSEQVEVIQDAGREQERGNEVMARGAHVTRDVAQQTQRTTEEQSRGAGRIRHSMESIRDTVDQIHAGLQEQTNSCRSTVSFLEQVFERTCSNEESSRRLGDATRALSEQAAVLREDVRRFRIQ